MCWGLWPGKYSNTRTDSMFQRQNEPFYLKKFAVKETFICILWASPKGNKSLGTWETKSFLSMELAGLKSQVDLTL
jgi:hypothetical protein